MINPKEVTKALQECVTREYMGVVLLDRARPLSYAELIQSSVWMMTDRVKSSHKGVVPSKDLRKLIWKEDDNRWFKEGRGVAYAAQHPETGDVIAGLGILVPTEKGKRMRTLTKSDVYIEGEGAD